MYAMPSVDINSGRSLWHVMVDLAYESANSDSSQDGVEKVRNALNPLVENGSGIKQIIILRLPEKD